MALVGALRTFGATAPLTSATRASPIASSLHPGSIAKQLTQAFEFGLQSRPAARLVRVDVDVLMQTVRTALLQTVIRAAFFQRTLMKDARQGLHSLVGLGAVACLRSP